MGNGSSNNQVRSVSGKVSDRSSSCSGKVMNNNIEHPTCKDLEENIYENKTRSRSIAESKKSASMTNRDILTTTKSNIKTLTPVHATHISQLSTDSSNKEENSSVAKLNRAELLEKLKQIELQLAKSEGQRLDAMDQLQVLEEKLKSQSLQISSHTDSDMSETIHVKDQLIMKLEKDLKTSETEAKTTRLKLKRRIKNLTSRLQEVRQESSVGNMEMKGEITQLKEQLKSTKGSENSSNKLEVASSFSSPSSQSKLIVELSNQMTEQSERIKVLENQLIERDAHIECLQRLSKTEKSGNNNVTGDRLRSGRGTRNHKVKASSKFNDGPREPPLPTNGHRPSDRRPSYSRQSTALSDSDSDWEMGDVRPQAHSAPARSRVKSAVAKKSIATNGGASGDDDSIMQYLAASSSDSTLPRDVVTSEASTHHHKKSVLRKHLEKNNNNNKLIGPSLAFSPPGQDPIEEALSCEPTPRYKDNPARLPGFSNLTVVETVNNLSISIS